MKILFDPLPYSVIPLWVLLIITIPLIIIIIYLSLNNLKRRFLKSIECSSGKLQSLISHILYQRSFQPSFYMIFDIHGQLSTIIQFCIRKSSFYYKKIFQLKHIQYQREILKLLDGGSIALDWGYYIINGVKVFNSQSENLVILQHGLGGNSKSGKIDRFLF